ncbi:enoyl-CoA hydratase-related protein [Trebonia sp.]|uniref:enoyl-CoA hydratase-related protein n=1 Tax=Trebonia sp. TaxID=2767075 RepID=UPI002638711F|nr:enoyl-CoA hydratase-related protein [Trebonia sp.]
MSAQVVVAERRGQVAILTMNRPEKRNALSSELADGLRESIAASQDAACIVLTGAGSAFCAGLDLAEAADHGFIPRSWLDDAFGSSRVPIIAAVNGPAVTAGLEIALACDFMIGSQNARFADTHGRVGTVPGGGMTVRLPARTGVAFARQMGYTAELVDADTALRVGLINELVPHERLLPRAVEIAEQIARVPRGPRLAIKRMYDELSALAEAGPLAVEWRCFQEFTAQTPPAFSDFHASLRSRRDSANGGEA